MNLPNRHIQNLLDCLTRSRLSFALYRLPWTDECYFVLQQSGDVEQLADIRELNKKKGFVMAPFLLPDKVSSTVWCSPTEDFAKRLTSPHSLEFFHLLVP